LKYNEKHYSHQTPTKTLDIVRLSKTVEKNQVDYDVDYFSRLCEEGCPNFGKKYSCPPYSPSFERYSARAESIIVICHRIDLSQYEPLHPYHRIKASNSVLKSIIDRELMQYKKKGYRVAGSGSCRACKPCGAKVDVPCKKPERRIYSLESLGINVDKLVRRCFGFDLQWYNRDGKAPEHTCVVGAVFIEAGKESALEKLE